VRAASSSTTARQRRALPHEFSAPAAAHSRSPARCDFEFHRLTTVWPGRLHPSPDLNLLKGSRNGGAGVRHDLSRPAAAAISHPPGVMYAASRETGEATRVRAAASDTRAPLSGAPAHPRAAAAHRPHGRSPHRMNPRRMPLSSRCPHAIRMPTASPRSRRSSPARSPLPPYWETPDIGRADARLTGAASAAAAPVPGWRRDDRAE